MHITYLSHVPRYQDERYLNTHLLRWQPETIVNLPEGIGFIPFQIPGSPRANGGHREFIARPPHCHLVQTRRHGALDVSVNASPTLQIRRDRRKI